MLIGGIEAGGTKFVLAVGASPTAIAATHTIATRTPSETLREAAEWFAAQGTLSALGIGSFGPVELDRSSPDWGHILKTPKAGWSHCDLAGYFERELRVPIAFDTDVNAAALAEYTYGAGKGASSMSYVTVGTGIGGGTVIDGRIVHGAGHPELGHIYPRRDPADRAFEGNCPFHGDCLEGLASGPAILTRWGKTLSELPDDHEAHEMVAGYLAQLCHTLFAGVAVETVVMGGGVMQTRGLIRRIETAMRQLDQGYLPDGDRRKIVIPGLGSMSGITGALTLGMHAHPDQPRATA